MAKIALLTTGGGARSGVSVFMEALQAELTAAGHYAELLRPIDTPLKAISNIGDLVCYALLRDRLKEFDLAIGNGVGTAGAIDLPIKLIDNLHSTAEGASVSLRAAYESITETEKVLVEEVLQKILGKGFDDVDAAIFPRETGIGIDRLAARRADSVIAVAPQVAQDAVQYLGAEPSKVITIVNGIDGGWFEECAIDPSIDAAEVNVIFTGRGGVTIKDIFLKGIDRVVGTAERLADVPFHALMVVHGEEKTQAYRELCETKGISAIFNLPNTELKPFLRPGDIHIHTSRSEACNLSQLEAMAAGLVPVTFEAGIVPQLIEDGVNGFKVKTIEEMVEKIQFLVANPMMRRDMAAAAQRTVRERHAYGTMIEGYLAEIERLLAE